VIRAAQLLNKKFHFCQTNQERRGNSDSANGFELRSDEGKTVGRVKNKSLRRMFLKFLKNALRPKAADN
jgi:hypothetical protein